MPDWLREGAVVRDPDGERWVIRSIGVRWVTVGHADRGEHGLLRQDLVEWVERGEWTVGGSGRDR